MIKYLFLLIFLNVLQTQGKCSMNLIPHYEWPTGVTHGECDCQKGGYADVLIFTESTKPRECFSSTIIDAGKAVQNYNKVDYTKTESGKSILDLTICSDLAEQNSVIGQGKGLRDLLSNSDHTYYRAYYKPKDYKRMIFMAAISYAVKKGGGPDISSFLPSKVNYDEMFVCREWKGMGNFDPSAVCEGYSDEGNADLESRTVEEAAELTAVLYNKAKRSWLGLGSEKRADFNRIFEAYVALNLENPPQDTSLLNLLFPTQSERTLSEERAYERDYTNWNANKQIRIKSFMQGLLVTMIKKSQLATSDSRANGWFLMTYVKKIKEALLKENLYMSEDNSKSVYFSAFMDYLFQSRTLLPLIPVQFHIMTGVRMKVSEFCGISGGIQNLDAQFSKFKKETYPNIKDSIKGFIDKISESDLKKAIEDAALTFEIDLEATEMAEGIDENTQISMRFFKSNTHSEKKMKGKKHLFREE